MRSGPWRDRLGGEETAPTMAERDNERGNRRRSLIALGVVALLFVIGWLLAHALYASGKLEDCLMSGRTNCAPIEAPGR
jgi:hypothetical protein